MERTRLQSGGGAGLKRRTRAALADSGGWQCLPPVSNFDLKTCELEGSKQVWVSLPEAQTQFLHRHHYRLPYSLS
jgi:hypothetical protein